MIVDKIVRLLKSRGFSQEGFERKIGWSKGRISKWVAGLGEVTAAQAWAASKELGVDIAYLVDPAAGEPSLPGRDEFALVTQLVRELGAAESFRRLTNPDWSDLRRSEGGHDVPYAHGKRVEDDQPLRQRRKA